MYSRGVTAILVEVINSALLTSGIRDAEQAHIPVISWGGGLAPGVAMSSEQNGGAIVANDLLTAMGGKGVGSIITFVFHEGLPCIERAAGFCDGNEGLSEHHSQQPGNHINGCNSNRRVPRRTRGY